MNFRFRSIPAALASLVKRAASGLSHLARQLFSREGAREPGFSVKGSVWTARGWLTMAPLTIPRRQYQLYVPAGFNTTTEKRWPLMVWIHGCRQTPEAFRDGTRVTRLADKHGLLVLLPKQTRTANPFRCWNWFDRGTATGGGEVALVMAQIDEVCAKWPVDPACIAMAGLSSGAALTAAFAVNAPHKLSAVAMVAGLPSGAANAATARDVMHRAPDVDVALFAQRQRKSADGRLPALVMHGANDAVVDPLHAREMTRQMLAVNGEDPVATPLRAPDRSSSKKVNGRVAHTSRFDVHGETRVALVMIEGAGHAWSGGDPAFEYHDAEGPDATAMIVDFFLESFERAARKQAA